MVKEGALGRGVGDAVSVVDLVVAAEMDGGTEDMMLDDAVEAAVDVSAGEEVSVGEGVPIP